MPGKVIGGWAPEVSRPRPTKAALITTLVVLIVLIAAYAQTGPGKVGY